jgi:chaperonin GroEL (HSP60 family)
MDRINQVKPNVIIVEKEISRTVLGEIRKLDITVVTNVKRNSLEKIARCTETLIIPSTNLIEKNFSLGSCKRFFVKLGTTKVINQESKIMTINQSLIYFDGCKPWYGSTICLSGPNDRYLNTIKKYIQKCLKYCRDIVLEKEYLFLSDGDSKTKSKSPYLLPKIGIGKSSLKYVKVSIRNGNKDYDDNDTGKDVGESDSIDDSEDGKIGENEAQVKKNMNHH